MRIIKLAFLFFFALCLVVAGFAGFSAYRSFYYLNPQTQIVYVQKGSSARGIASQLQSQGVIKSRLVFEIYLHLIGKASSLKHGEYRFDQNSTLEQVAKKIYRGEVIRYFVTVPEGYSLKDIRRLFASKNLMSAQEFDRQMRRVDLLQERAQAADLEGYLFPETYSYDSQTRPAEIIEAMVATFYRKLGTQRVLQARSLNMSLHQLITFASVVEKETGLASERPLIAGVFYNRLKKGMLLQSDPTVIYGIAAFSGNLTRAHLTMDTPYNTYTRQGLPPGPICNPGLASVDAILHPMPTSALYFVARGDGSHFFSDNLDDHNRAVQQYQRRRHVKPFPVTPAIIP